MYVEHPKPYKPAGWQALVVDDTVRKLTVPTDARYAKITVRDEPIRYRDDGTNPSSTVGMLVKAGEKIILTSREQLEAFRAIRDGLTSGNLEILYYKI